MSSPRHHRPKQRTTGGYARRLAARGIGKAPVMPTVESLRRKQADLSAGLLRWQKAEGITPLVFKAGTTYTDR